MDDKNDTLTDVNPNQPSGYGKRPLWQWILIYLVFGSVVYAVIYFFIIGKSGTSNTTLNPTNTAKNTISSGTASTTPTPQKFKDSPDAKNAFQIFPGSLSDKTKEALSGFNMETTAMPDGSTQVMLTSTNPEYQDQQFIVKPGYTLYFIERNLGDDSIEANEDRNLKDDTAVLVDPQGMLVK